MTRDAILSECAQHLRASSFEYEQLLVASLESVWHALSALVERQLLMKKGVNVAMLGKFTFVRDVQPVTPVFLLADRFTSLYSVAWKRPPPALVAPAVDANMSLVGSELGLPKEQVMRTLEALTAFLGSKLQRGAGSGRLRFGNVGYLCLDGKALSFAFSPAFVRTVSSQLSKKTANSSSNEVLDGARVPQTQQLGKQTMQRSMSTDSGISSICIGKSSTAPIDSTTFMTAVSSAPAVLSTSGGHGSRQQHHHHKHKHRRDKSGTTRTLPAQKSSNGLTHSLVLLLLLTERHTRSSSHLLESVTPLDSMTVDTGLRQVLPRFLLASKRVPDGAKVHCETPGSPYALALQSAFERERELRDHNARAVAVEDAAIAERYHATQLRKLHESAERTLQRRELNAFLSGQIDEKQTKERRDRLAAARASDYESTTILPHDPRVTAAAKRHAKQTLCARLSDQVAAKHALAKDTRALETAEAAYFIAQLQKQTAVDESERQARKQRDKQALLDGWQQQQALRASAGIDTTKRMR